MWICADLLALADWVLCELLWTSGSTPGRTSGTSCVAVSAHSHLHRRDGFDSDLSCWGSFGVIGLPRITSIGESDDGGVYLSHLHLRGVRLRREGGWGPLPLFPTGRVSLGEVACGLGSASHSSHECTTRFSVETGIFGGDLPLLHVPVRLGATSSFGRFSTPRRSAG